MTLAGFFICEGCKEIHKVSCIVPLFHTDIVSDFGDCFCVNPIGIICIDERPQNYVAERAYEALEIIVNNIGYGVLGNTSKID